MATTGNLEIIPKVRPQPLTRRDMAMKLLAENECRPGSTFTYGSVAALLETAFARGIVEVEATLAHYEQLIKDTIGFRKLDLPEVRPDEAFVAYFIDQVEWSLKTFGPAPRTAGIIEHARKELNEIEQRPYDLMEWIDLAMLAFDGFHRHGGNPHMALELLKRKQAKNIDRNWPDWREHSEHVAIEHDRSGE